MPAKPGLKNSREQGRQCHAGEARQCSARRLPAAPRPNLPTRISRKQDARQGAAATSSKPVTGCRPAVDDSLQNWRRDGEKLAAAKRQGTVIASLAPLPISTSSGRSWRRLKRLRRKTLNSSVKSRRKRTRKAEIRRDFGLKSPVSDPGRPFSARPPPRPEVFVLDAAARWSLPRRINTVRLGYSKNGRRKIISPALDASARNAPRSQPRAPGCALDSNTPQPSRTASLTRTTSAAFCRRLRSASSGRNCPFCWSLCRRDRGTRHDEEEIIARDAPWFRRERPGQHVW